jgi:hypothetical protein
MKLFHLEICHERIPIRAITISCPIKSGDDQILVYISFKFCHYIEK